MLLLITGFVVKGWNIMCEEIEDLRNNICFVAFSIKAGERMTKKEIDLFSRCKIVPEFNH